MSIDLISELILKTAGSFIVKATCFECIDSTNAECKRLGECGVSEGTAIVALNQTAGIGTRGRSFFSPDSGIYMSVILKPKIKPTDCGRITTAAAVAVAEALKKFGADAGIKWVNDILINNRKVCGILTESRLNGSGIDFAVLGIGINLTEPRGGFPDEIKSTAGAVFGDRVLTDKEKGNLCAEIFKRFGEMYSDLFDVNILKKYRELCVIVGKTVTVSHGEEIYQAVVKSINDDFSLEVQTASGEIRTLQSGEVCLKI